MSLRKTIVVTGSNKGIGYNIINRLLGRQPEFQFIMAVRNLELGQQALKNLSAAHPSAANRVKVENLDLLSPQSIKEFVGRVSDKYGGVDCLINNAGMVTKNKFDETSVKNTLQVNYFGAVDLSEQIKEHVHRDGKIIMVGAFMGKYRLLKSDDLKRQFVDEHLDKDSLNYLIEDFQKRMLDGSFEHKGWPKDQYAVSKIAINTYARVLGKDSEILSKNIQVYSVCPGWCKTDMGGPQAKLTAEQGAVYPSDLVEAPWDIDVEKQGKFFSDGKISPL